METGLKLAVAREMLASLQQAKKYWFYRLKDDLQDAVAKEEFARVNHSIDFLKGYISEIERALPF